MPTSFTISFKPQPSRVQQLLHDHRPWKMMDNMALIIVNQTYAALLEILGPAAAISDDDGRVEVTRPVDPTDPDSPLLSVNASATDCCICLVNSLYGGATSEYERYTSPKQKSRPQYRLPRASVSVSSGTVDVVVSLAKGAGGVRAPAADGCWTSADDVRPNVAERGLFGVLDTITARLDAAIRIETRMIEMARASGCASCPRIDEIVEVRAVLEKMRGELDLDAVLRRRRQKRRRGIIQQQICREPDANIVDDHDADALAKGLRELHVSQKRCSPAAETDQADDADVLAKRLRALQV